MSDRDDFETEQVFRDHEGCPDGCDCPGCEEGPVHDLRPHEDIDQRAGEVEVLHGPWNDDFGTWRIASSSGGARLERWVYPRFRPDSSISRDEAVLASELARVAATAKGLGRTVQEQCEWIARLRALVVRQRVFAESICREDVECMCDFMESPEYLPCSFCRAAALLSDPNGQAAEAWVEEQKRVAVTEAARANPLRHWIEQEREKAAEPWKALAAQAMVDLIWIAEHGCEGEEPETPCREALPGAPDEWCLPCRASEIPSNSSKAKAALAWLADREVMAHKAGRLAEVRDGVDVLRSVLEGGYGSVIEWLKAERAKAREEGRQEAAREWAEAKALYPRLLQTARAEGRLSERRACAVEVEAAGCVCLLLADHGDSDFNGSLGPLDDAGDYAVELHDNRCPHSLAARLREGSAA